MNQLKVESNNTSSLQQGTPTKLACFVKEKPKLRGKYIPGVYTGATYSPKSSPSTHNRKSDTKTETNELAELARLILSLSNPLTQEEDGREVQKGGDKYMGINVSTYG